MSRKTRVHLTYRGTFVAPFLQTGQEVTEYGYDRSALRNHKGELILSGRQFQGNLRHFLCAMFGVEKPAQAALGDLEITPEDGATITFSSEQLVELFGVELDETDSPAGQNPSPAGLKLFDATLGRRPEAGQEVAPITGSGHPSIRSAQDPVTGAAKDGAVFVSETHFAPQEEAAFVGTGYALLDEDDAPTQAQNLAALLQWASAQIPLLGADKSAGVGRLKDVTVQASAPEPLWRPGVPDTSTCYELVLTSEHPLLISPRDRSGHVLESQNHLPGDVLFGAVADWLRLCGEYDRFADVLEETRFLHAYPTATNTTGRPVPTAFLGGMDDSGALVASDARRKDPVSSRDGLSLADIPTRYQRTRTAIQPGALTPQAEQLFTSSALSPEGRKWIGGVEWVGTSAPPDAFQELVAALGSGLARLGKTAAPVQLNIRPTTGAAVVTSRSVTIRLLSDAWITDFDGNGWMRAAYEAYFRRELGEGVVLTDFCANQDRRTTPRHRKTAWPVTLAGSVFELDALDKPALDKLNRRVIAGLRCHDPEVTYGDCPFVPANGYGEIAVES